jgi:hypothetical protein
MFRLLEEHKMKMHKNRFVALTTLGIMTAGTFGGLGMIEANASAKGRRNTTIALGAVTAYGLLKKKKTIAIAGGIGTVYAYSRYRKAKKEEDRRNSRRSRRFRR